MQARLFSGGGALLLSQTNHIPLGKAKNGLSEALEKTYLGKLFANNYGWSTVGMLLAIVIVVAVLFVVPDGHQGLLVVETRDRRAAVHDRRRHDVFRLAAV